MHCLGWVAVSSGWLRRYACPIVNWYVRTIARMTRRMSKQHLALAIEFEAFDPHTTSLSRLNLGVFIRPRRC